MFIGEIKGWPGASVPDLHLLCDGSAVSRAVYRKLFDRIGTRFGSGDGSTTFNLPDLTGLVLIGKNLAESAIDTIGKIAGSDSANFSHTHIQPNHTHQISGYTDYLNAPKGTPSGKTTARYYHRHAFGPFTSSTQSNNGMNTQLGSAIDIRNPAVIYLPVIQYATHKSKALQLFYLIH